jgi:hypothetical protein
MGGVASSNSVNLTDRLYASAIAYDSGRETERSSRIGIPPAIDVTIRCDPTSSPPTKAKLFESWHG